jgi:hypothetical protein
MLPERTMTPCQPRIRGTLTRAATAMSAARAVPMRAQLETFQAVRAMRMGLEDIRTGSSAG